MERLHKVLAARGVASRRKAEKMIAEGRVKVDGEVVQTEGFRVDPDNQKIEVDGRIVRVEPKRYLMLNKPPGYITTSQDERGRRTVLDLVDVRERVVPVGRLDRPTTGLLLLTNDGDLAHRVTHPRFELEKEYEILLDGHPPRRTLDELVRGVTIDGVKAVPSEVRAVSNEPEGTLLRIVIHEGRNRIVRRMIEHIGYNVVRLSRIRLGPVVLQGVPRGSWRDLTPGELEQLWEAVGRDQEPGNNVVRQPERREDRPAGPPARPRDGDRSFRRDAPPRRSSPGGNKDRRNASGQSRQVRDRDRRPGGVRKEHGRRRDS